MMLAGSLSAASGELHAKNVKGDDETVLSISYPRKDFTFEFGEGEGITSFSDIRYFVCEEHFGVYGSVILTKDGKQNYDGYVAVFDNDGEPVVTEFFGSTDYDTIRAIALMDESLFIWQEVEIGDHGPFEFSTNVFYFIEPDGLKQETTYPHRIIQHEIINGLFYFSTDPQGDYQEIVAGHNQYLQFGDIHGVEHRETYQGSVDVHGVGLFKVNGETYENHVNLTYPGHYVVSQDGTETLFTLDPVIEGTSENDVHYEPLKIAVSHGHAFLNDALYLNDALIETPGNYRLRVEGVNDYVKELPFTIAPDITGVSDGGFYTEARTVTFDGEGTLNGTRVASGVVVGENGAHVLEIEGVGGYYERIAFEVEIAEDTNRFLRMEFGIVLASLFVGVVAIVAVYKKR